MAATVPTIQNGDAYSYARCSSPEQARKGHSIERQEADARAYCERNGLKLLHAGYHDLGVSAFRGKNNQEGAELYALIETIKAGKIRPGSTLIIENLDRLSRDFITESLPLFMSILRYGVFIVTLSDNQVYSTESVKRSKGMDLFVSIIQLTRSHDESERKSYLIGKAWKRQQEQAGVKKIAQSYPAWLELKDNKFRVIQSKASVIRTIFSMYLDGQGTNAIARYLNQKGIPTFTGKTWFQTTVKFYLKFPAVIGEYHAGQRTAKGKKEKTGQVVPDYYPNIIDASDFYRVQAKFKLNPVKHGRPQREDANLFKGIIQCGYCGGTVGIYNAAKSNAYVCWNAVAGHCIRVAYSADDIDYHVVNALEQILVDWYGRKVDESKIEQLEGELAAMDEKINKVVAVMDAAPDIPAVVAKLKDLNAQKVQLAAELQTQQGYNNVNLDDKPKWYGGNSPEERLSIMPYIRRHVRCVRLFPAGDKKALYKKRLAEFAKKGINGSRCYHSICKELDVKWAKYFTLELVNPINHEGQTGSILRFDALGNREVILQHPPLT